jgi:hypothetical protein
MSAAFTRLEKNIGDADDLVSTHEEITGGKAGRPERRAHVINKSGIVIICAFWQAYCEDVLCESLIKIAKGKIRKVPDSLRAFVGRRLIGDDSMRPWALSGSGWKTEIARLATQFQADESHPLNSPSSASVRELFKTYLGIRDITKNWHWQRTSVVSATKRLDGFVRIRHRIAHRGRDEHPVLKSDFYSFGYLIGTLANKMEETLEEEGFIT